jgi:hypothetical protein
MTKKEYDELKLNELRECGQRISKMLNITQEDIDRACKEARRICK